MRKTLGLLTVAAVAVGSMAFVAAPPAGARTSGLKLVGVESARTGATPDTPLGPQSKIKNKGADTVYAPDALTVPPSSDKRCTLHHGSATVKNRTTVDQTITYNGKPVLTIQPQVIAFFCSDGPASYVLGIVGSSATLTITFS
jgi:hypothetical protein